MRQLGFKERFRSVALLTSQKPPWKDATRFAARLIVLNAVIVLLVERKITLERVIEIAAVGFLVTFGIYGVLYAYGRKLNT